MQITVIRKSDNSVITRIFEDEEGIKEITDDDYEVLDEATEEFFQVLYKKRLQYHLIIAVLGSLVLLLLVLRLLEM